MNKRILGIGLLFFIGGGTVALTSLLYIFVMIDLLMNRAGVIGDLEIFFLHQNGMIVFDLYAVGLLSLYFGDELIRKSSDWETQGARQWNKPKILG